MKTLKRLIIIGLIVLAFIAGAVTYKGYDMYLDVIEETPIADKVLEIQSDDHYTSYDAMTKTYIDAVIAVEDRKFMKHKGVNFFSTMRAAIANIKAREVTQGGSSITQQLARNMYFDQTASFSRKIAEMFIAFELEKEYDKEEIFEMYANCIYFGSGYYGIYDAAMGYFDTKPSQLTGYMATMLAGIPNAPSVYSLDVNPDLAEQRRQQVIEAMISEGYIHRGEIK